MKKAIGQRIKALREARGLSQRQLAEALGCSAPNVSMLESGKQAWSLQQVEIAAELLKVNLNDLLGLSPAVDGDPDEVKLVSLFRELEPRKKAVVLELIQILHERNSEHS